MTAKTPIALLALALAFALSLAPGLAAAAQEPTGAWRGQDNEFGSIRTPYTLTLNGQREDVEAKVVLKKMYEDRQATFFMFAWSVQNTPLDVESTHLVRMDTGAELPCVKSEGSSTDQLKCFVDRKDLPPVGTEIVMQATVGAKRTGSFMVGAIVQPFTYTWGNVAMSNGLDAELYGDSVVNVQQGTSAGRNLISGAGNVPFVGIAAGVVALAVLALVVTAARRKKAT